MPFNILFGVRDWDLETFLSLSQTSDGTGSAFLQTSPAAAVRDRGWAGRHPTRD